jgi:ABC-type taurine transport system substrate-binding protein
VNLHAVANETTIVIAYFQRRNPSHQWRFHDGHYQYRLNDTRDWRDVEHTVERSRIQEALSLARHR